MLILNKLLELFRGNNFFHRHRLLAFDAGEVVKIAQDVITAAFVQIHTTLNPDNQIVEISCGNLDLLQFHWALHRGLMRIGQAMGLKRAKQAVRVLGCTVQGTEFH